MPTIRIDDIHDPRLDPYRNVRDADLIRDRGSFMIEGRYILRALLRASRYPLRSLLLNDAARNRLADAIEHLPPDTPVYVAPQSVMDDVVGFHIHRGCLAEGARTPEPPLHQLIDDAYARPILILEDLTNHDNVGGIFRSALALGAGGVILTTRTADPLYRKAIRVSMGATLQLPFSRTPSTDNALNTLRDHGYATVALCTDPDAHDLRELRNHAALAHRPPAALLIGTEGQGLTRAALDRADARARINLPPSADALNAAAAATVALYELSRI